MDSPRKAQEKISVVHKPCASHGYRFYGEALTLAERHHQDTVQYSDRATVLYHIRFLPVDTGSHSRRNLMPRRLDVKFPLARSVLSGCLRTSSPLACC